MVRQAQQAILAARGEASVQWTIVLPCHREGDALFAALERFDISPSFDDSSELVILLSELSEQSRPAHHALARWSESNTDRRISVIVCPAECTSKALKLDHYFRSIASDATRLYLVVDVDANYELSMPRAGDCCDGCTFQAVPFVRVGQGCNPLAGALAVAHAERSAMEAWSLAKWERRTRPFLLGFMGAGMAFDGRAVQKLLPWHASSDDIRMGYRADLLALPRVLLGWLAEVQAAPDARSWIRQQLRIADGVFSRRAEVRRAGSPRAGGVRALASVLFDWLPGFRLASLVGMGLVAMVVGEDRVWLAFTLATLVHCWIVLYAYSALGTILLTPLDVTFRTLGFAFIGSIIWVPLRAVCACAATVIPRQRMADLHAVSTGE